MTVLVFLQCLLVSAIAWRAIFEQGDFWCGVMIVAMVLLEVWDRSIEQEFAAKAQRKVNENDAN